MTNDVSPIMLAPTSSLTPVRWQTEKLLHDGDRVVILTDVERIYSPYLPHSEPQELFRVGIYDLRTNCLGFASFGKDWAFAMVKGSVPVAPWGASTLPIGVELRRHFHGSQVEGRFVCEVSRIEVDPAVVALMPTAQKRFRQQGHVPNAVPGMWSKLAARAKSELAIEKAALAMQGVFKAGDIRAIVGNDKRISRVLARLVKSGRLTPVSRKKYMVTPPKVVLRADWTD